MRISFIYLFCTAVAAHNQSLIGSKVGTPQKLQPQQQQAIKAGATPIINQSRQVVAVPTPRTPINVRSIPPTSTASIRTPSFGQYNIISPTPIASKSTYIII